MSSIVSLNDSLGELRDRTYENPQHRAGGLMANAVILPGLGDRFEAEVRAALLRTEELPESAAPKYWAKWTKIDTVIGHCHIAQMASKAELVKAVQKQLKGEVSKADVNRVVTAVFNAIKVGSKKGKSVQPRGFGTFKLVKAPKGFRSGALEEVRFAKRETVGVAANESNTSRERGVEPKVEGLAPNEERLAVALSAMISAAGVHGKEALRVIRTIGETIEIPSDAEEEAFERVRLRSLGADAEMQDAEGGGLSDIEFATGLGLSARETVRQYREKGRIFAWRKDLRSYRYPAWQIHRTQLLPGLSEVLAVLKEKDLEPLSIIGYFLTPSDALDDARPLDLLREGKVAEVVADAKRYGDIGS
jgi:nucleoid DNA-binding protein